MASRWTDCEGSVVDHGSDTLYKMTIAHHPKASSVLFQDFPGRTVSARTCQKSAPERRSLIRASPLRSDVFQAPPVIIRSPPTESVNNNLRLDSDDGQNTGDESSGRIRTD
jgi:hypothetical protein